MSFQIAIVGLGLMGGSLAMALRGFRKARVVGCDTDPDARDWASRSGAVDRVFDNAPDAVRGSDLVIFCVYAHHIPALLADCLPAFKSGVLLSDICGVKVPLYRELEPLLPQGADYVGIHPMAGKEKDGFAQADAKLFLGTGSLICPWPSSHPEHVELMQELVRYTGAVHVAVVPPERHDDIIAYTSDLMHISAAALCIQPHPDVSPAFTAGAFRDCTRIADINAAAWSELLTDNAEHTLRQLDAYLYSLNQVREALMTRNRQELCGLLSKAGDNKRELMKR